MLKNLKQMPLEVLQKESFEKQQKQLVIDNKITRVSRNSQQNNSETVTNKHDKYIPKERHISPEKRPEVIINLIFNVIVEYWHIKK